MRNDFFVGKRALLIGASEGIGKALAAELLRSGASVAICARNEEKLQAAKAELLPCTNNADSIICRAFDVVNYESTACHITALTSDWKSIDFLFNCAGYAQAGYFDTAPIEFHRQMMEVNYLGTVNACHAALPHMAIRDARIINFASVAGFLPLPGYTGYCASKYAVVGFSLALRKELMHRGIRVSVVCPPNTNTPGLARENIDKPKELMRIEEKIALLEPDRVARVTLGTLRAAPAFIYPSISCRAVHALYRWFPGVADYMTRHQPHA